MLAFRVFGSLFVLLGAALVWIALLGGPEGAATHGYHFIILGVWCMLNATIMRVDRLEQSTPKEQP